MRAPRFLSARLALIRTLRDVRRTTGKPMVSQLRESISLRLGAGKLPIADYFAYELYDDRLYPGATKHAVVGWNSKKVTRTVNDPYWRAVADDKLICYAVMKGLDLPHPQTYALYHGGGRGFGTVRTLRTRDEVARFLRDEMSYPFFAKPVAGLHGSGASLVTGLDADRNGLRLDSGKQIGLMEYIDRFVVNADGGYLFQELLRPHPDVRLVCGNRLSTARVIILNDEGSSTIFRVLWRIPVGGNITDNFLEGTSGNLMAYVDPRTGVVQRVIRGGGRDSERTYGQGRRGAEVREHPDTGTQIRGMTLPDWGRMVEVCTHAASAFPGIRYQSWDVAMCPSGPVLVELNSRGALMQMPGCPGICDSEFSQFLQSHSRNYLPALRTDYSV